MVLLLKVREVVLCVRRSRFLVTVYFFTKVSAFVEPRSDFIDTKEVYACNFFSSSPDFLFLFSISSPMLPLKNKY